jgi:hypothetical protein
MQLPNGDRADLGDKLEDYCLNPAHRQGQHKARVFESVLGITMANAEGLRAALLDAAANSRAATFKGANGPGDVYEIRFSFATPDASATVHSVSSRDTKTSVVSDEFSNVWTRISTSMLSEVPRKPRNSSSSSQSVSR